MTTLPIYAPPTKGDILEMAREACATAGYDFEAEAEEDQSQLRQLQAMMGEWEDNEGIVLGFNYVQNGYGATNDDSGIPRGAVTAVSLSLAMRLAPTMGKTMATEAKTALARSMSALRAKYCAIPTMGLGRGTIRGAGARRWGWESPFFPVDVPVLETVYVSAPTPSPTPTPTPTPSPTPTPTPTPTPSIPRFVFNLAGNSQYLGAL